MKAKIIETADGSKTIYLPEMDEQFHSVNGAVTESNYVYLEKGFIFNESKKPIVFEVGFGTGLNVLLTAIEAEKSKKQTTFYTIEKYPLANEWLQKLNYGSLISAEATIIFDKIHAAEWDKLIPVTDYLSLYKIKNDLKEFDFSEYPKFDVIYFDAFGPDKQPEMWTPEIFEQIYNQSSPGCVFVTYSAKGEIRRQLQKVGYNMERLPGPPGKKQMLRGIKNISKL